MKKLLWSVPLVVLITALLSVSTASGAKTSPPVPQAQFFHAPIQGTTLPDNGTTIEVTISFTTNQSGAIQLASEDHMPTIPLGGNMSCVLSEQDTVVVMALLDGTQIASIQRQGRIIPNTFGPNGQVYGCINSSIGLTTTHAVVAGQHTLTLKYTSSTNPNPPFDTGTMVNDGGTLSLIVATPATSN